MKRWIRISQISLCAALAVVTLVGCAGSRAGGELRPRSVAELRLPPFSPSLEAWPRRYRQNFQRIQTFRGEARLTLESPQGGGSVNLETLWDHPNKLFLKAEGPLGLDVGKIFVGQERFIWYNQYDNHFTSGSLDDPYLNRFLQTNITFHDLKYAVLGFAVQALDSLRLLDATHGVFATVPPVEDEIHYRLIVNPETGLLESVEALRESRVFMRQDYKRYRIIQGVYVPTLVQITMLDQRERVSVFYKDLKLNRPIDPQDYLIEVSTKVEQLNLN